MVLFHPPPSVLWVVGEKPKTPGYADCTSAIATRETGNKDGTESGCFSRYFLIPKKGPESQSKLP